MKNTIIVIVSSVLALSAAKAATSITAYNYALGTDGFAFQVVNNETDVQPYSGTLLIGTFTTTDGLGSTPGSINLEDYGWTLFASTPFNTSANHPGLFGTTSATETLPLTSTGPFIGNNIFAVVANADNTDFIIWDSGLIFNTEIEGVGGAAVSFAVDSSNLLRGIIVPGGNKNLAGAVSARNGDDAVTFGAIPEPSALFLGAIGALGLLRRRRN